MALFRGKMGKKVHLGSYCPGVGDSGQLWSLLAQDHSKG